MRLTPLLPAGALVLAAFALAGCPVTIVERAVEARSAEDIVTDNRIVIAVNRIMADLGTVKAGLLEVVFARIGQARLESARRQ